MRDQVLGVVVYLLEVRKFVHDLLWTVPNQRIDPYQPFFFLKIQSNFFLVWFICDSNIVFLFSVYFFVFLNFCWWSKCCKFICFFLFTVLDVTVNFDFKSPNDRNDLTEVPKSVYPNWHRSLIWFATNFFINFSINEWFVFLSSSNFSQWFSQLLTFSGGVQYVVAIMFYSTVIPD